MRHLAFSRFVILVACALLLLLGVGFPVAAQPLSTRVFLPVIAQSSPNRIAYFGSESAGNAVLGVVDVNSGARNEVNFSIADNSDNLSYTWSPTAAMIAFNEFECFPAQRLTPCNVVSLVIARADGSLTRIAGSYGRPIWSPDGSQLAVTEAQSIELIPADGSAQTTLVSAPQPLGSLQWMPDGQGLSYINTSTGALSVVMTSDGMPKLLATDVSQYWWAPTSDAVAVQSSNGAIAVVDPVTLTSTLIDQDGSFATPITWSPDGSALTFKKTDPSERLFLANRDGTGMRDLGEALSAFWSPDSAMIAVQPYNQSALPIEVLEVANDLRRTLAVPGSFQGWSPDGTLLAIAESPNLNPLMLMPLDGSAATVITGGDTTFDYAGGLQWSPNDDRFAFLNRVETPDNISGVRLLVLNRDGRANEVIPGPYSFRLDTYTWVPNE